ncbi:SGNH/GDSL hydrolase family protein [Sphingobium yanoikuyae]
MGSSFAAGAGIGPTKPNTPTRCQRTSINYASLLVNKLALDLTDVTCGGATTAHLLGPWNELLPQIAAVRSDTRLVTVTIGGNDIGYVAGLMTASCRAGVSFRGRPCPPGTAPREADYRELEDRMRAFAKQVSATAPRAKLVFVQYVTLVPNVPCYAAPLRPDDARVSRALGLRLAQITSRVARESGAVVLSADKLSRDHTPCSAVPWSEGLSLRSTGAGAPWHPNAFGHAAIAHALSGRLGGGERP